MINLYIIKDNFKIKMVIKFKKSENFTCNKFKIYNKSRKKSIIYIIKIIIINIVIVLNLIADLYITYF